VNQTRIGSLIETVANTAIGFGVALASQLAVFPLFDIHVAFSTNLAIGAWFTGISVVRGYLVRRFFNARLHRAAQVIAEAVSSQPAPPMHADREPCPSCLDTVRGLQRTREVGATCPHCGMRWLHGRYVARPTNDETRTK
jgi:hypothetical protein